jgi:predicted O-methyltransferase YrrM
LQHDLSNILEVGFYHGKSSAYFAAILEDEGRGHLATIDMANARQREPNIVQVLESVALSHRVTPIFCRSLLLRAGKSRLGGAGHRVSSNRCGAAAKCRRR